MAVIRYKPTSPARRNMSVSDFAEITSTTPERSLLVSKNKSGGRNNLGRITVRHIGGGNRNRSSTSRGTKTASPPKLPPFNMIPTAART